MVDAETYLWREDAALQDRQAAVSPGLTVGGDAVVPAALDVERYQVHSVQSCVEEVVLYLHIFGKM